MEALPMVPMTMKIVAAATITITRSLTTDLIMDPPALPALPVLPVLPHQNQLSVQELQVLQLLLLQQLQLQQLQLQ